MSAPTSTPAERSGSDESTAHLFEVALDMARAAKAGNVSGWLAARYECGRPEDVAFLLSRMLGVLIENDAIGRGVHPADVWGELRARGIDEFG